MEQVAISPHYRGKDRARRVLADSIPPGPYLVLAAVESTMIGRVWSKDMIAYGISDGNLEPGMMFWRVGSGSVFRVRGTVASEEGKRTEYLERVAFYELTDVQRRRIYCWKHSCRKVKMRDNQ